MLSHLEQKYCLVEVDRCHFYVFKFIIVRVGSLWYKKETKHQQLWHLSKEKQTLNRYLSNQLIEDFVELFIVLEVTFVEFCHCFVVNNTWIHTDWRLQFNKILNACPIIIAENISWLNSSFGFTKRLKTHCNTYLLNSSNAFTVKARSCSEMHVVFESVSVILLMIK